MTRGARSGNRTSGDMFLPVPVAAPFASDPASPFFEYDLNGDVAGALLDLSRHSIWRYASRGRGGVFLPHKYPYGRGGHRYYSLADLETFARTAWAKPRRVHYGIIPRWYLLKHNRLDLEPWARREQSAKQLVAPTLPADEQLAVDMGWPRGCWAEQYDDGVHVFGPSGERMDRPMDMAAWVRARAEIASLGGDPDSLIGLLDKTG